jgi:signal transduction histidine kinase
MNALRYLGRRSRASVIILGILLVALLGIVDYATGSEFSFSIFYLLPISMVAWFVGFPAGALISVLAAIAYLTDTIGRDLYSHASIPYWNTLARLGFFFIVASALSSLRATRNRREELLQFIIHDLRSPLANVMTGLEILHDDADARLDSEQKNFVEMCMASCRRMLTLINALLDLPRLEKRRMFIKTEPVLAEQLCSAALNQVRLLAKQKGLKFREEYPEEMIMVHADSAVTIRVLENILSNAVKFSPEDSTVTIRVYEREPGTIAFSIHDEGEGIPEEWSEKVFDTYSQGENHRSTGLAGSGLGLTFSRYALEAQRGHIWLDSGKGTGTTITFALPRASIDSTVSSSA